MLQRRTILAALPLVLTGCGFFYGLAGYPPEPLRKEAPNAIESTAIKVGADAPFFTLDASTGQRIALGDVVKDKPAVLLFYRGHW